MKKKELRAKYKALRSEINHDILDDKSITIANQILQLSIWDKSYYHIFLPITKQKEINTEYILNILQGKDKNIIVSKSDFDTNTLTHFLLTDTTTLKANPWGIPEPVDGIPIPETYLEVVFIPLLAFDKNGNRVGYGKGFYDRFLSKCNSNTIKVGLSLFKAEERIDDVNTSDIRLDYCVTPDQVYSFSDNT